MRFDLEGLDVFFPYDYLYKEQYEYMLLLKRSIQDKGHVLLEMPTGTGKTVCLISLITSYQLQYPQTGKLIYCTRTVPEMSKCMEEIRRVINYRVKLLGEQEGGKILALCLSSRRNMCIHPDVLEEGDRDTVDSLCRKMTASWVRESVKEKLNKMSYNRTTTTTTTITTTSINNNSEVNVNSSSMEEMKDGSLGLCDFYENYSKDGSNAEIPQGVYSLDDLKELGHSKQWCPYFMTRHLIHHATILVYNYQYMLDPKVANLVSKELEAESIVVFDEAHNIDNVCIEALSVTLDRRILDSSIRSIGRLQSKVAEIKASDSAKLAREYTELVQGLAEQHQRHRSNNNDSTSNKTNNTTALATDMLLANPVLSEDILEEAVPGNIRKAEHFVAFLKKVVMYFKTQLAGKDVVNKTPLAFLHEMHAITALERKPLRFTYTRLNSLLRTLEITSLDDFNALQDVANFATLVSTYMDGFAVITEPAGTVITGISEPLLRLCCLDASIAIKPVLERFHSVVITSGTLSPIDLYPKLLNFRPVQRASLPMSTFRPCLLPLIVTRGSDQIALSTRFESRKDTAVIRNYGQLLIDIVAATPDGVCGFFTSYQFMEYVIGEWDKMHILQKVLEHKLIYLETKDVVETTLALDNFKRACDCGRGAVFLSVARGKVAEGIDFDRHYGRCVVLFGIPYQYTLSHVLRARLNYMRERYQIKDNDFLTFDALRQSAQCVGRIIRSKTDYGIVVLADSRYNRLDKREKFPPWILQFVRESSLNLPTDGAVDQIKSFLKQMGQPIEQDVLHSILLNEQQVIAMSQAHKTTTITTIPIVTTSLQAHKIENISTHLPETTSTTAIGTDTTTSISNKLPVVAVEEEEEDLGMSIYNDVIITYHTNNSNNNIDTNIIEEKSIQQQEEEDNSSMNNMLIVDVISKSIVYNRMESSALLSSSKQSLFFMEDLLD